METRELRDDSEGELRELATIYEDRGLPADLARRVAEALSACGALSVCSDTPETPSPPPSCCALVDKAQTAAS